MGPGYRDGNGPRQGQCVCNPWYIARSGRRWFPVLASRRQQYPAAVRTRDPSRPGRHRRIRCGCVAGDQAAKPCRQPARRCDPCQIHLCVMYFDGYQLVSAMTAFVWMFSLSTAAVGWSTGGADILYCFEGALLRNPDTGLRNFQRIRMNHNC